MSDNWRDRSNQKKSNYWQHNNHQKKRKYANVLSPGLKGFLCTCVGKFREKECIRDSYNLLNEFADKSLSTEAPQSDVEKTDTSELDIDDSLAKEIAALKDEAKVIDKQRFQVVDSGANGVIFIKSTVPDTVKLAFDIVSEIAESKQQKSKFLLRLVPIEVTCKAYLDDISSACDDLLKKYFSAGDKTYAIVFSHRNNSNLSRDSVIEALAAQVTAINPSNKVDLKTPDLAIIVEVIRGICCLAVVPDYYKLKKYNILELSGQTEQQSAPDDKDEQQEDDDKGLTKEVDQED